MLRKEWETGILKDTILIELYLQALDLSKGTEKVDFDNFEKKLFKTIEAFSNKDQRFLYWAGLNHLIQQNNKGNKEYQQSSFIWLQFGLTQNLLVTQQIMEEAIFSNIVISGCQEKKFDWVLAFIKKYQTYLPKKNQAAAVAYYQSLVYYSQGDWEATLAILAKSDYKSIYQPRSRIITIRALFEQFLVDRGHWELLLAHLQAFESYIRRNEDFAKEKFLYYKHFFLITRQLVNRIQRFESVQQIQTWFDSYTSKNTQIAAKSWLSEKVANL